MQLWAKISILILFFLVFLLLSFLFSVKYQKQIQKVCFNNYCFKVEIADTPEKRRAGLMHRVSLPENQGMLFVFEKPGIYGFWMKNTLIPLDIIWLDENFKVVYIKENVQPCLEENCPIFKNSNLQNMF
jgi:hypothetical protein